MSEPTCRWCDKPLEEHANERSVEAKRYVCQGLRNRFLPRGSAPHLTAQREYEVWPVKLLLCEACLLGMGEVCHTPACALCRHDAPGPFPIMPELYEVVDDEDASQ